MFLSKSARVTFLTFSSHPCRILTIHNNPENLKPPPRFKHLKYTLADVDTEDISKFFAQTFDFIEDAREANQGAPTPALMGVRITYVQSYTAFSCGADFQIMQSADPSLESVLWTRLKAPLRTLPFTSVILCHFIIALTCTFSFCSCVWSACRHVVAVCIRNLSPLFMSTGSPT